MKNISIQIDKGTLLILFEKYKDHLVSLLIMFVSVVLFTQIIMPQIQEFFTLQDEEKAYEQKIQTLQANITFISNLKDAELNTQLETVSTALPLEKDFAGIINAISRAAQRADVVVGDFTFSLGELSSRSAQADPSIQITLRVNGENQNVRNYTKELMQLLPLSEVHTANLSNNSGSLLTAFYYRPVTSVSFDPYTPLTPLTANDKALLQRLQVWQKNGGSLFDLFPGAVSEATSAATPTVSPAVTPASGSANVIAL